MDKFLKLGNSDMPYYCLKCYRELFPFQNLTDNQLRNELTETKLLKEKKIDTIGCIKC